MTYMDPRPEGLNTDPAPKSVVETLAGPDHKTVTFDARQYQLVPKELTDEMFVAARDVTLIYAGQDRHIYREEANDFYRGLLAAAPTPAAQSAGQEANDLQRIYDAFGIGSQARDIGTLMVNIGNVIRFSDYLHAIEREFFMVPGEPDDDYPDDQPADECLLNCWGSTQQQYIEQFRAAIPHLNAAPVNGINQDLIDMLVEVLDKVPLTDSTRMVTPTATKARAVLAKARALMQAAPVNGGERSPRNGRLRVSQERAADAPQVEGVIRWFRQPSSFGPWHECSRNDDGAVAFAPVALSSPAKVGVDEREYPIVTDDLQRYKRTPPLKWPDGYCLDPNGRMVPAEGKAEHYNFGYEMGWDAAWETINNAVKVRDEMQAHAALSADGGEGCTPADAKMLRFANHSLENVVDEYRTALGELVDQIEKFAEEHGEADFETERALRLLNGLPLAEKVSAHGVNTELLEALEGVVRVADRKTDEFDRAREIIAKAKGE